MTPQPWEPDDQARTKIRTKLEAVQEKGYIWPGSVTSLTSYFAVPKGDSDDWVVYDASKSGINASLWAPSFCLLTSESFTNLLDSDSWMSDLDVREMFLNFPLDPAVCPFCGVDLRPYFQPQGNEKVTMWERWEHCMMGLGPSPYCCIKILQLGYEMVTGNTQQQNNAFHWSEVMFNLPGSASYNPGLPWMQRIQENGKISGATSIYVDDIHPIGHSAEHCRQVSHQTATRLQYLGIQITSRKTWPPS